jgi:hypothetical protein
MGGKNRSPVGLRTQYFVNPYTPFARSAGFVSGYEPDAVREEGFVREAWQSALGARAIAYGPAGAPRCERIE